MDEWNLLDLSYLVLSYDAVTSSSAAAAYLICVVDVNLLAFIVSLPGWVQNRFDRHDASYTPRR